MRQGQIYDHEYYLHFVDQSEIVIDDGDTSSYDKPNVTPSFKYLVQYRFRGHL